MEDSLGDRLKAIEQAEAGRRAEVGKPIMVRLDGRHFSAFTRGLQRPYDVRMSKLMLDTTRHLVEETQALIGYTQSDEISLVYFAKDDSEYLFNGKYQKLTSTLAAMASVYFNSKLAEAIPEKAGQLPTFDARVWQVENLREAYLNLLWRQDDASRNSISMAAQARYSHRKLQGVGSDEKKQWLRDIGDPWEAHPKFFKYGVFVKRVVREMHLTPEMLAKIPEAHRPTGPVARTFVENIEVGPLREYENPQDFLFGEQK